MNFIIKLSKFKKSVTKFEYNLIMIIMNKFIKKAYFVSFHKKMKAEKIIYLFKWYIIVNHEKTIIVLKTDLCVTDNKKKNNKMTSWWYTDRTFWNW